MPCFGLRWRAFVSMFLVAAAAACGSGSDGGSPTAPSPAPGGAAATITITNSGVSPDVVDISPGQRVEFINSSGRTHEIFSTPHGPHSDCPPINDVGEVASGQRKMTGALTTVRICGFHDHRDPSNNAYRGTIRVGTTTGPAPEY